MVEQLKKYPELLAEKTFDEVISENAIKHHLKNFNKAPKATSS